MKVVLCKTFKVCKEETKLKKKKCLGCDILTMMLIKITKLN